MQVTVENVGGLVRRMTVQVPAERIDTEVASRLQSMARTVRIDGFRAGKVPLGVVEKKFGKQVRLEVVNQVLNATMQEALASEQLRPAANPAISSGESRPGEPLQYTATFEVFPDLQGSLSYNFTINRPVVEISASDIDGMLENLRRQRTSWNRVERAAQSGDQLEIDFAGSINGEPFTGGKAAGVPLVLGSGSMIPGFEDQLIGVSAGESRTIQVTFPANYGAGELAGKTADFAVTVHGVSESVLPELSEEFARSFGIESGDMNSLRADIVRNMQRELRGMISSRLKEQVFTGLLSSNPVEVPRSLVATELGQLRRQQGAEKRSESELAQLAERRVKLGVLVSELARQSQLQLDPARVRDMIETIASSYETPDEVVKWYYSNQDMLTSVQTSVMEELVAEWVIEHGGVNVVNQQMTFNELVEQARQSQA